MRRIELYSELGSQLAHCAVVPRDAVNVQARTAIGRRSTIVIVVVIIVVIIVVVIIIVVVVVVSSIIITIVIIIIIIETLDRCYVPCLKLRNHSPLETAARSQPVAPIKVSAVLQSKARSKQRRSCRCT